MFGLAHTYVNINFFKNFIKKIWKYQFKIVYLYKIIIMELKRGDKIYLDLNNTKESLINEYLNCRDGIITMYEYHDSSGYGSKTRLYLCENTKHEHISLIRQVLIEEEWKEEDFSFDSDSFEFLKGLLINKQNILGGKFKIIRNYNNNNTK